MTAPPDLLSVSWDLPLPPTAGEKAIITSHAETIPSSHGRQRPWSAHLPLSPVAEGEPAIRPLPSPDKGPFCAICFEGPRKKPVPVAVPESPSRVKT